MTALTAQAQALASAAAALPATRRAPRVAVRVAFRDFHADRPRVRAALDRLGFESAGSQDLGGVLVALESGTDTTLAALVRATTEERSALARVVGLELARPILSLPADPGSYADGRFEAVLHPRLDAAPETALARFAAFVASLGGEVNLAYARLVDGLIFVPVRLSPAWVSEMAAYQPLRVLRPMGRIALREA